jgi:hypothetical protein
MIYPKPDVAVYQALHHFSYEKLPHQVTMVFFRFL